MNNTFKAIDRHGTEMEFEIIPPNKSSELSSDMNYRKAYTEALKLGLLPKESIKKILKDNGIWTDQHEKDLKQIMMTLGTLEIALEQYSTSGDVENCVKTAGSLAKKRNEMWELIKIQQSAIANSSCDAYAELVRIESNLAARVVIKINGQKYWKSYQDYVMERDNNENATVATQMMDVAQKDAANQHMDIMNSQPEQKWLKDFKERAEKQDGSASKQDNSESQEPESGDNEGCK